MTTPNIDASASTQTAITAPQQPANNKALLTQTREELTQATALSSGLDSTLRKCYGLNCMPPLRYVQNGVSLLSRRAIFRIQTARSITRHLEWDNDIFRTSLNDAETSLNLIGAIHGKLSVSEVLALILVAQEAEDYIRSASRFIDSELRECDAVQFNANSTADSDGIPDDEGIEYLPSSDYSVPSKLDLLSYGFDCLCNDLCREDLCKSTLIKEPSEFIETLRRLIDALRWLYPDVLDEQKEDLDAVLVRLGFIDKAFANGMTFKLNDIPSLNLILLDAREILISIAEEENLAYIKEKLGGNLDENSLH